MKELVDALVKAQSEMTHGLATGTNPHFKSEYAPLDEVIKAVKKPLNDNGIFFLQKVCHYPHLNQTHIEKSSELKEVKLSLILSL